MGEVEMGGIQIILKNEKLQVVATVQLVEDHRHVLIPATVASTVKELLAKHRSNWRNIEIKVL